MKKRVVWNLDLNHARLLRDMIGVAQYDCKQDVLAPLEVMYAKLTRLIEQAEGVLPRGSMWVVTNGHQWRLFRFKDEAKRYRAENPNYWIQRGSR